MMTTLQDQQEDLLRQQLKSLPAFRALLRAVEARFYHHLTLPDPILDVGCGDGHFAQMALPGRAIRAGVDPWWGPLQKASRTNQYEILLQGLGDSMPFPDESFSSAFSNSVLEHIPDLPPVLSEINRVLRRGASFVITTPSHLFTDYLGGGEFFDKLKLSGLAGRYRNFFNLISRHAHTDSPETWTERLAQAGFMIERWQYYFSREALHALEIGHVQGLPSAILHALTGHWIIAPWDNSLKPTERWVRPFYEESPGLDGGAYLLIVARKMSHQAIPSILPPPLPLKIAAGENTRHDQPFAPAS